MLHNLTSKLHHDTSQFVFVEIYFWDSRKKFDLLNSRRNAVATAGEQLTSTWQRFAAELSRFLSFATCPDSPLAASRSGGNLAPAWFLYSSFSVAGSPQYFAALNLWSFTGLLRHRSAALAFYWNPSRDSLEEIGKTVLRWLDSDTDLAVLQQLIELSQRESLVPVKTVSQYIHQGARPCYRLWWAKGWG